MTPSPPRACFGRDELIERIVGLAENLNPIALIGPGGIGKTSLALAVLHNDRIKNRFGDSRRFIRCDQFSASLANFLNRLSKVTGAGVDNPEDLTPLRPFLSSKEMLLVLDNAESILDPQGVDGKSIYEVVEELSKLDNVSLCITSRITTVPPDCKYLDVPTLTKNAAHNTFYYIYGNDKEPGRIDEILTQLDFHPLSVTLLATVARQNKWGNDILVKEWERHQTGILQTEHSKGLDVTIKLTLASPVFQQLGPDARGLLGIVAFFPQGVNENNLDWLFPTISNRSTIFDQFCMLSLTYRSNGFITMLAPLRNHLCPKDPRASTYLCTTRDFYVTRLSCPAHPDSSEFENIRWIISEDSNIEHLLDVFTPTDSISHSIWIGCVGFMWRLHWHKPRRTVLGLKIEQLPDDHCWKPFSLFELSRLFKKLGNHAEHKRLLAHALQLWRDWGDYEWVGRALIALAAANLLLGFYREGIIQAQEALGVYEMLGCVTDKVECLTVLARLLLQNEQLDAAEKAIIRSINLLENGPRLALCHPYRILGEISHSRGEREKAIYHYNAALGIAYQFNSYGNLSLIHLSLATVFRDKYEFNNADSHIKQAKQYALHGTYQLGRATEIQAEIWYRQGRFEDGVSEVLCAIEIYEKLGEGKDVEKCRELLRDLERAMQEPSVSGECGEVLEGIRFYAY